MSPEPSITAEEYVARWAGADGERIGAHRGDAVRAELWPWLLERGYATGPDTELLEPFLERVAKRNRDVHLRPGLSLRRHWGREEVARLGRRDEFTERVRASLNDLLVAVGDPPLPAH
jgi:hypothetical protein